MQFSFVHCSKRLQDSESRRMPHLNGSYRQGVEAPNRLEARSLDVDSYVVYNCYYDSN